MKLTAMNVFIAIVLIAVNAFLVFMRVEPSARPAMFKIYGLALPATFLLAILFMLILKLTGYRPDEDFKKVFLNTVTSLLVIILINLAVLFAGYLVDRLVKFHVDHNAANIKSFPVRFVMQNRDGIVIIYKLLFLFGSAMGFYGLWVAKR